LFERLKKWYKDHKKEIANGVKYGVYFFFIVSIPFIAIIFASINSSDKILSSQGLFTGFIAYCGIIISFCGIYWKTTREEEKAKKEKEEEEKLRKERVEKYLIFSIKQNKNYLFNNNWKVDTENLYKEILEIRRKTKYSREFKLNRTIEGYISNNIDTILKLETPKAFIEIDRSLKEINNIIQEFSKDNRWDITHKISYELAQLESKGEEETFEKQALNCILDYFYTISLLGDIHWEENSMRFNTQILQWGFLGKTSRYNEIHNETLDWKNKAGKEKLKLINEYYLFFIQKIFVIIIDKFDRDLRKEIKLEEIREFFYKQTSNIESIIKIIENLEEEISKIEYKIANESTQTK
jgi:hypothetical protein